MWGGWSTNWELGETKRQIKDETDVLTEVHIHTSVLFEVMER